MSSPRVSIVLPSFDGARYLESALASIEGQTFQDWELVLVDDGSSDGTGALMDGWARRDPRIRALHLAPNRGLPAALNEGFRHARGELFTWTSDDNLYAPEALLRMVGVLEERPGVDLVYADYVIFDEGGGERRMRVAPAASLPFGNRIGACFLYRREVHDALDGFDEALPMAEDYDFWLRAHLRFRMEPLHESLYRYRDHDTSLSARRRPEVVPMGWRTVERHLPGLDPAVRCEALLRWARRLFVAERPAEGRANVFRALRERPGLATRPRHRAAVAQALFGRAGQRLASRASTGRALRVVLPDALGGVTSYVLDLGSHAAIRERGVRRLWLEGATPGQSPSGAGDPADDRVRLRWPRENLFSVLRRMHRVLKRDRGALLANELFGLAYAARHGGDAPIVQILHGDIPMYYELAERFDPWVDAFVAVSARVAEEAARRLPHRAADVHHFQSAVPSPRRRRVPHPGPLRLVYTGRLSHAKGVLDLPEIERGLRARGVSTSWTIIGAGPEEDELAGAFDAEALVDFRGGATPEACREALADHDVFVLPSHGEGLSLSLLEAMAAGVVPVVSDLESGTREVVEEGRTGLLARPQHPQDFVAAIARLAADREQLERMSRDAAARIASRHPLDSLGDAFLDLVEELEHRPRRARPAYTQGPSRLDRPWLPNLAVRGIRAALAPKP